MINLYTRSEIMSIINEKRIREYQIKEEVFKSYLLKSLERTDQNIDYFTTGFPHVSEEGVYPQEPNKLWTASFFPGMVNLAYGITKDEKFLRNQTFYLDSFEERLLHGAMDTHDIGFLFSLTCVALYKETQNKRAYDLAIAAADRLITRYNERGKYIQAWGKMGIGVPNVKIIIDCMLNLPLLYWTFEQTKNPIYDEVAREHATTSASTLVRSDGSTYHTYLMDPISGRAIQGKTHQGLADETTWARGQAWSLYGFTLSYMYTKDPLYLDTAIQNADYFINNLPENYVCYWDFSYTDIDPDIRDTSAASIGAAGLLELAKYVDPEQGKLYKKAAKIIMQQLCEHYFVEDSGNGLLKEGMYHRNNGFNESTSWGDYFFLEALSKINGYDTLFW